MIKTLQEKEDVGREFFSPRGSDDTTRKKVAEIKKQIEEIQLEQIQVGEQIEQAKKEEEKYQNMLVEARSKNAGSSDRFEKPENPVSSFQEELKEPGIGAEQENEQKKELKIILERVEKCISLLGVDKGKCKHEMTNLKILSEGFDFQKQLEFIPNVSRETFGILIKQVEAKEKVCYNQKRTKTDCGRQE